MVWELEEVGAGSISARLDIAVKIVRLIMSKRAKRVSCI